MSETKLEHKQAKDEDNRKVYLENHTAYDLVDMVSYVSDVQLQAEFRDLILQFVIDNNIDLKQL